MMMGHLLAVLIAWTACSVHTVAELPVFGLNVQEYEHARSHKDHKNEAMAPASNITSALHSHRVRMPATLSPLRKRAASYTAHFRGMT